MNKAELIKSFISQCPDNSELIEFEEDGDIYYEICIPYSKDKKYPVCEIKINEGKVQIWGHYYQIGILDKAKKHFGSSLRF